MKIRFFDSDSIRLKNLFTLGTLRRVTCLLAMVSFLLPILPVQAIAQSCTKDLTGYRVINLDNFPNQEVWKLGANENVVFTGSQTRSKRLRIEGGNNVVVKGVRFEPVYTWKVGGPNATGTIQTVRTNGSIWIEDVYIDNKRAFGSDAITLNSAGTKKIPATIINTTAINTSGSQQNELHPNDRAHGDILQPQGAISTLTVVNFNGSANYQGMFLMKQDNVAWGGKVDNVYLENVNLWHTAANTNCAYLLAFGGTSRQSVTMKNVTLTRQPRAKACAGESVNIFPNANISGSVQYTDSAGPKTFSGGSCGAGGTVDGGTGVIDGGTGGTGGTGGGACIATPPPFDGGGQQSKVIHVYPGQSINAAIAQATPGTDILVHAGTYNEAVKFEKSGTAGNPIRLISADGKGKAIIVGHTPISSFREHDIGVFGFTLRAGSGRNSNGIQMGGTNANDRSSYSYNVVLQDNIIERAGQDGIKLHQAYKFWLIGNTIVTAGNDRNSNGDGGIDFVAVDDSVVVGNIIQQTYGHACLMMKGGSDRNYIANNLFRGCERDGITVGGFTTQQYRADSDVWEARWNTVVNNEVHSGAGKCPIYMTWAWDNTVKNNKLVSQNGCTINANSTGERANLRNQVAENGANVIPGGATGCMPTPTPTTPTIPEEPPQDPGDTGIPPAETPQETPMEPPVIPPPPPAGGLPPPENPAVLVPGTESNNPVTGCAVDTWNAMVNQAVLQTRRETMLNQRFIAKPDSVLAYSCFIQDAERIATDAGPIFSESTRWVNKQVNINGKVVNVDRQLGPTSLDGALVLAVAAPYEAYMIQNFSHGFLGGMIDGPAAEGDAVVNQANAPCGIMNSVWQAAKCRNFGDDILFPTFEELISQDPRVFPPRYECNYTGITQDMINTARHANVTKDPIITYQDILNPENTCAPPIETGIEITTRVAGDQRISTPIYYLDGLCINAGCSYQATGEGLGTCVAR